MSDKGHWESIHSTKSGDEVSWYQPHSTRSLELITEYVTDHDASIIDIGAGSSMLVDDLIAAGYRDITLLDIAAAGLERVRARLDGITPQPGYLEGDITTVGLPAAHYDLWHDRAVFHFLTEATDRDHYLATMRHAIKPGGLALIATFAEDGPTRCSGLDVVRYSFDELHATIGIDCELVAARREAHHTPGGSVQSFGYGLFRVPGVS